MIIAITGTLGSGKGTVVELLKASGFKHYSVREYLLKEIAKRGLPNNRDSMRDVANELRRAHGPGYIIGELLKEATAAGGNSIIESIRALGEVELLRREASGCVLIAVDAPIETRYQRIGGRGSSTDHVSFERFMEQEKRERASGEAWDMNLNGCIAAADFHIENGGTLAHLERQTEAILQEISP